MKCSGVTYFPVKVRTKNSVEAEVDTMFGPSCVKNMRIYNFSCVFELEMTPNLVPVVEVVRFALADYLTVSVGLALRLFFEFSR